MQIEFRALPSDVVARIRQSGLDDYGNPVERNISQGDAQPCRHGMGDIREGPPCLILAHRPFEARHAFTETGPIFLCAKTCKRAKPCDTVPETLRAKQFTRRSYDHAERIIYRTGKIVPTWEIAREVRKMLAELKVAFVDVRSASNNCFQCRIERS